MVTQVYRMTQKCCQSTTTKSVVVAKLSSKFLNIDVRLNFLLREMSISRRTRLQHIAWHNAYKKKGWYIMFLSLLPKRKYTKCAQNILVLSHRSEGKFPWWKWHYWNRFSSKSADLYEDGVDGCSLDLRSV